MPASRYPALGKSLSNIRFLLLISFALLLAPWSIHEVYAQTIAPNDARLAEVAAGTVTEANAIWWGFNAQDATEPLQKALDSGVKKLTIDVPVIDGKSYSWIVRPMDLKSDMEITFAEGVEILAKQGEFLGKADCLFKIVNQKNVTLKAAKPGTATFKMRKADYHQAPYQLAEWRHTLNIKSSENIVVDGLNLVESGGDGIYLGVGTRGITNTNVTIRNCVCDGNNRQGISVITAKNLLIEKSRLCNTGGTAPQSGIDFEPNCDDEQLTNCVMRDCVCENNAGAGIDLYLPNLKKKSGPIGIRLENIISRNNARASVSLSVNNTQEESLTGVIEIQNCVFENDKGGLHVRSMADNGCTLSVINTTIKNCSIAPTGNRKLYQAPIVFSARALDERPFGRVTFNNVQIVDENCTELNGEQPYFRFIDGSLNGYGLSSFNGNLQWTCCGKTSRVELNDQLWKKFYPPSNIRRIPVQTIEPQAVVPVTDSTNFGAQKSIQLEKIFARHGFQAWLYAKAGQTISFSLLQKPVGRAAPAEQPILLTSPSGKKTQLPTTESGKEVSYSVAAKETGVYLLDVQVGSHAVCLTQSNVPSAINCQPSRNFVYSVGSLYFWVPEGTKEFGIKFYGMDREQVKATVFAPGSTPEGAEVWKQDNISSVAMFFTELDKPVPAGIWRIRFDRPAEGVLEDFGAALVGLPSILSPAPELLLKKAQ